MNIRDLSLDELLNLLPPSAQEECTRLCLLENAATSTSQWEERFKTQLDRPLPAREMLKEMLASEEHAKIALALFVRSAGFAFANSSDPDVRRMAWAEALGAIGYYILLHIARDAAVHSMINRLIGDIQNIFDGCETAILKGGKTQGRPAPAMQHQAIYSYSAAILDVLVGTGQSERAAADEVAKLLHENGWPLPPSTSKSSAGSAERLLNWRARIRSKKGPAFALETYHQAKRDISAKSTSDSLQWLVNALKLIGTKV